MNGPVIDEEGNEKYYTKLKKYVENKKITLKNGLEQLDKIQMDIIKLNKEQQKKQQEFKDQQKRQPEMFKQQSEQTNIHEVSVEQKQDNILEDDTNSNENIDIIETLETNTSEPPIVVPKKTKRKNKNN